ncbi:MAG: 30S ribosomal protein S12 methylthiotransferase RimO [Gemmatimonadota bacterium]
MTTTGVRGRALPVLPAGAPSGAPATSIVQADGAAVRIITLGCDKNSVDSERLLAGLVAAGAAPTGGDDADVLVINTCGFIEAAREESIEVILEALRLKREGRVRAVAAVGCLVQRYRDELRAELPDVDLFLGLTDTARLIPELRARGLLPAVPPVMERPLRMITTATPHTSWLKISEGCDHGCAFCAIPLMRGKHRSTSLDTLVAEAVQLERAGVVELDLVSQDTTWYGRDLRRGGRSASADESYLGRPFAGMPGITEADLLRSTPHGSPAKPGERRGMLPELLHALLGVTSIPWLRLFYMYPSGIGRDLVELIASEPRIVDYLDMPIQHGSDRVLERMRRPERQATIRERVRWLRDAIPDVALRTTVIVGFPGETDTDFDTLLELLEEIRFDHVGAFAYSIEEGTPAATMPDPVPDALKRERLERVVELQRSLADERTDALIGTLDTILVDRVAGRASRMDDGDAPAHGAVGRSYRQALEIDGVVHLPDAGTVEPGQFVRVRYTDATDHDLEGAIVDQV